MYVNESLAYISALYPLPHPDHIVVIGHSMGGVVARKLLLFTRSVVTIVFTLASPHLEPPLPLTRGLVAFYEQLNSFWRQEHVSGGFLENVTLVSIAGGTRDTVLDSRLTKLDGILSSERSLRVFSSAIPGVWSSSDHVGSMTREFPG